MDTFDLVGRQGDAVRFRVVCGGGTYVRVLAAEVGRALVCGAHLTALRRTAIGPMSVTEATPPDKPGSPLPLARAVEHLPHLRLEAEEAVAAGHGRVLGPAGIVGPYAVCAPDGTLLGIYRDDGPKARPEMILAPA